MPLDRLTTIGRVTVRLRYTAAIHIAPLKRYVASIQLPTFYPALRHRNFLILPRFTTPIVNARLKRRAASALQNVARSVL